VSLRVVIELGGPPRGKGAGRASIDGQGHARIFTDERTRKYESQLRYAAQMQMGGRVPTAQPVSVVIEARLLVPQSWSKKKRLAALAGLLCPIVKPDCNNYSKTLDALNGVVGLDNKQIVDERVSKISSEHPGLTVTVETMEPPARLVGVCRVCGCTDAIACPGGCYWVETDLCSSCAVPQAAE